MKCRAIKLLILSLTISGLAVAQEPTLQVPLRTFTDQPLPVRVVEGSIHPFGFTSELKASIAIAKGEIVDSAEFYLVVFHGTQVLGGEGWVEKSPLSLVNHQTKLAFHEGDDAILIVDSVVTANHTFSLAKTDISANILHLMHKEAYVTPPLVISMAPVIGSPLKRVQGTGDGTGSFCASALSAAVAVCGSINNVSQVASFSCSASTQNFSFSCKGSTTVPVKPAPSN